MLRIFRSPKADFERDAELADQVYTTDALESLADAGFNAVWVRIIYRQLLQSSRYPSFGRHSEEWLASLNRVAERGAQCGMQLVLYCQEPFGLPLADPFWTEHPEMGGATSMQSGFAGEPSRWRAMCTSTEPVQDFLREASEAVLRRVPGLAAVITITASEFLAHCYSRYATNLDGQVKRSPLDCPRCQVRAATDVVVEVLNCMRRGMNAADSSVPLIAWNWSWTMYEADPQPSILSRLDDGIDVQAGFERGDWKTDATGREIEINEYSLSFVGPSERFKQTRQVALDSGRQVYTKLQLSTTHELATVSNIPLIGNLYGKAKTMRQLGLAGFMGCWNFGNELTLNTEAFNFFLSAQCPEEREGALAAAAERAFAACAVPKVLAAWSQFGAAFDYYPFSIPFLYYSPINYALALPMQPGPIHERPIGRSWQMDPRDADDDPTRSFGPFAADEIARRLGKMVELWGEGLSTYGEGLEGAGENAEAELCAAQAVHLCLRSIRNYFELYLLKRDWHDDLLPRFGEIATDEIGVLDAAIPVHERDPRQGYHSEAHDYMVTPELMRRKREWLMRLL